MGIFYHKYQRLSRDEPETDPDGKERETRNAHRIIRSGVLEWGELAFLRGLPLVIVLAAVALIIEKTQFLARADAKHPLLHQAQGDGEDLGRRAAVHPRA